MLLILSGLLSPIPAAARYFLASAALMALVLNGLGIIKLPLPTFPQMIPQERFRFGETAGAAAFGLELGLGFRTYLIAVSPWMIAIVMALAPPPAAGVLAISIGWALGRSSLLVTTMSRKTKLDETFVLAWQRLAGLKPGPNAILASLLAGAYLVGTWP